MAVRDVAAALAGNWGATIPHLVPADLRLVADAIARIGEAEDEYAARDAYVTLTTVLVTRLPAGHPVREAISEQRRLVAAPADWAVIADTLRELPGLDIGSAGRAGQERVPGPGPAAGGPSGGDSDRWLLAAPALTARQVSERGCDPHGVDLIRLPTPAGTARFPAFQFGADGHPVPVVAAINHLLGADDDPWGVADWWLGRNAWLDAVPADLIGRVDDEILARAARAELGEE